jgi:hypothetical protein
MRRSLLSVAVQGAVVAMICTIIVTSVATSIAYAAGQVGARIIEIEGAAEAGAPGMETRALKPGESISVGEEINVQRGNTVTLALSDGTLRKFTGPTTLSVGEDPSKAGGTVIANLTAAVTDMLFSAEQQTSEAVMATRRVEHPGESRITVPVLIYPAPGERLMDLPRELRWMTVQGVPLYRVSVYNSSEMMWQSTISGAKATCPPRTCNFKPGETYYWVVEALVGNTTLRSEAGDFMILPGERRSELYKVLDEAGVAVQDDGIVSLLKARLCVDAGVFTKAIEILDGHLQESPDRSAYLLRAEIAETMGLMDSAISDYKRAITLPAAE